MARWSPPTTVSTTSSAPSPTITGAWAPVVADGQLVGIISARDAMDAYRRALAGNVRQVRGVGASEGVLLEGSLPADSPLAGAAPSCEADWPRGVVVVAVRAASG